MSERAGLLRTTPFPFLCCITFRVGTSQTKDLQGIELALATAPPGNKLHERARSPLGEDVCTR